MGVPWTRGTVSPCSNSCSSPPAYFVRFGWPLAFAHAKASYTSRSLVASQASAPEQENEMLNRSMATSTVIPVLEYPDVRAAVDWLCRAFGFQERLRIGTHRAQLTFGNGCIVVAALPSDRPHSGRVGSAVMIRVANAEAHRTTALAVGAIAVSAAADYPYGERQYSAEDPWGQRWTFSETIADVDPADWGGALVQCSTDAQSE